MLTLFILVLDSLDSLDSLIRFKSFLEALDSLQTSQKCFWIVQSDLMNPMNPKIENTGSSKCRKTPCQIFRCSAQCRDVDDRDVEDLNVKDQDINEPLSTRSTRNSESQLLNRIVIKC